MDWHFDWKMGLSLETRSETTMVSQTGWRTYCVRDLRLVMNSENETVKAIHFCLNWDSRTL